MSNNNLKLKAREIFYDYESKKYPDGDSPYSDDDADIFVKGWVQGYKFLNTNGEHDDEF